MLSRERCRELLGVVGDELTDADLDCLRDQLYGLADVVLSVFIAERDSPLMRQPVHHPAEPPSVDGAIVADLGPDSADDSVDASPPRRRRRGRCQARPTFAMNALAAFEVFVERAAIREFDGGADRLTAEAAALDDVMLLDPPTTPE